MTQGSGWKNHPIVKMWKGYEEALLEYMNLSIEIWMSKGFKNTMKKIPTKNVIYPNWLGDEDFHNSHKSNLLRKDKNFYSKYGWTVPDNLKYVWKIDSN